MSFLDELVTVDVLKSMLSDSQMKELGIPMGVRTKILSSRNMESGRIFIFIKLLQYKLTFISAIFTAVLTDTTNLLYPSASSTLIVDEDGRSVKHL